MSDPWDEHAQWWQREFTDGADPEYTEQILPLIAQHLPEHGRMIDVGCGEGQVARLAAARGLDVLGIDPAMAQIEIAEQRGGGPSYQQGSATDLPEPDASTDVVVACLAFEAQEQQPWDRRRVHVLLGAGQEARRRCGFFHAREGEAQVAGGVQVPRQRPVE